MPLPPPDTVHVSPLLLSATTLTTCLGRGLAAHAEALRTGRSGLRPCDFETVQLDTWIGEVEGVDATALPASLQEYDCRNNRLALAGLEADGFVERVRAAVQRYGSRRVGVFLGTSTSGILETELAYRARDAAIGALPASLRYATAHCPFSVTDFVRQYLGLEGLALTISTACSSSAKVFAAAARQMALGTIDAAVVGGVDSLCLTTLYGFASLQLTSTQPARPYDARRDGISIGEAAGFALLERADAAQGGGVWLLGTAGAGLWTRAIKSAVARPRPAEAWVAEGGHSFPSGHSAGTLALFGLLVWLLLPHLRRAWRLPLALAALALALGVGASRVLLRVHYASDVLAGWLLALAWGACVVCLAEWALRRRRT